MRRLSKTARGLVGACLLGMACLPRVFAAPQLNTLGEVPDKAVPAAFGEVAALGQAVHYLTLDSAVLGERRDIAVSLPASYAQHTAQRYPVLLLLDGPQQLAHTQAVVRFLARGQKLPEMLIVAVANTARSRDLTPASNAPAVAARGPLPPGTETGGADAFLRFLAQELLPQVDQRYRTARWRTLVGHSFGGLFGLHVLLHQPQLFDAYVLASPSLWWGQGQTLGALRARWPQLQPDWAGRVLFASSGRNEALITPQVDALAAFLGEVAKPGAADPARTLTWQTAHYPQDDHGTTPLPTLQDGLRLTFAAWPYAMPEQPTPADHAAYLAHRQQRAQRYGVDAPPTLFETTRFALAHAQAGQTAPALRLACDLSQRLGQERAAFGALTRIARALQAANGVNTGADTAADATERAQAVRLVERWALQSAGASDASPAALAALREQQAQAKPLDSPALQLQAKACAGA